MTYLFAQGYSSLRLCLCKPCVHSSASSVSRPFYFGHKSHRGAPQNTSSSPLNRASSRTTSKPSATSNTANANTNANANANANSHVTLQGLSFSEFIETIARLAITGMSYTVHTDTDTDTYIPCMSSSLSSILLSAFVSTKICLRCPPICLRAANV